MRKPAAIIFVTVFIYLIGFGLIIPIIPLWARQFSATPAQIGLLMATYSVFQFLFAPFWGRTSDRLGRRPVIMMCLLGEAVSYLMFALSSQLWMLFVARAVSGFFGGSIATASAYLADVSPPEKRSASMGLIGAAFGLGFIVGPALGGLLTYAGGAALAGYAVSGLCLATYAFAWKWLPESKKDLGQVQPKVSRLQLFRSSFEHPVLRRVFSAQLLGSLAMAGMETTLILWVADRFQWGMQQVNFGFVAIGLIGAFCQGYLVRILLPRWGEARTLVSGFGAITLGLGLIPLMPSPTWLALALIIFVFGHSLANPSMLGMVSLLSDPSKQGLHLGVSQSLASLGRIGGPVAAGLIYQQWQPGAFFAVSASGAMALLVLLSIFAKLPSTAKKSRTVDTSVNSIGAFQLENLIRNRIPFTLFHCQGSIQKPDATIDRLQLEKVLVNVTDQNQILNEIKTRNLPLDAALVFACETGKTSKQICQSVEKQGYRNCFWLEGGWQSEKNSLDLQK